MMKIKRNSRSCSNSIHANEGKNNERSPPCQTMMNVS